MLAALRGQHNKSESGWFLLLFLCFLNFTVQKCVFNGTKSEPHSRHHVNQRRAEPLTSSSQRQSHAEVHPHVARPFFCICSVSRLVFSLVKVSWAIGPVGSTHGCTQSWEHEQFIWHQHTVLILDLAVTYSNIQPHFHCVTLMIDAKKKSTENNDAGYITNQSY